MAQSAVDFSPSKAGGCSPLVVTFTPIVSGSSTSLSYSWDLGNGNTANTAQPEAIYNTVGTYTVTLTVNAGGQTLTATHTITVYAPPSISFTANAATVCGTPVTLTANTDGGQGRSIQSWLWDFGDGTTASQGPAVSHQFAVPAGGPTAAGVEETVSLTVTDNYGCTASVTQPSIVQVFPTLTVDFSTDKTVVCNVPDPVQFTNGAAGPGVLSYSWNFGDGNGSTTANPTYVYHASGTYTVSLTAVSSIGCTVTNTKTNLLNVDNYQLNASVPATICLSSPLNVTDNSTPTPTSRVWTVDGFNLGGNATLNYAFSSDGTHTVALADVFGTCPESQTKTIMVNPSPVYSPFTMVISPCGAPATVQYTDHTVGATARTWSFGQGVNPTNASGGVVATAAYPANGSYRTDLTVSNAQGCTTSYTQVLSIEPPSVSIGFTDNNPTTSCNTPITKSFGEQGVAIQSYNWNFGDGSNSPAAAPTHTYTTPGVYTTVLNYVTAAGCTGEASGPSVTISPPLVIDFTTAPTTVCTNAAVTLKTNFNSLTIYSFQVDWGDGSTSYNTTLTHNYANAGVYTVTITAYNYGGCQAVVQKTNYITVTGPSATYGGHTNTCTGTRGEVTFNYPSTNVTNFTWAFGDGTTTTSSGSTSQWTHTYTQTGTFAPTVTATEGQCSVTFKDVVYVLLKQDPVLSSTLSAVCANGSLPVQIKAYDNPFDYQDPPGTYSYTYTFEYADGTPFPGGVGNLNVSKVSGTNMNDYNMTLSDFQAGKSGLKVILTSAGAGCTDVSNTMPLTILAGGATPAVTVVSDDLCYQQPVVLKDASTVVPGNSISGGTWNFGDGATQPLVVGGQVSHLYSNPGVYTVQLTAQDAAGCVAGGGTGTVNVDVNGPKAAFSTSGNTVLLGNTLYLYNSTDNDGMTGVVSYSWNFGDGASSTLANPSHLYTQPGPYTVTLTASAVGSCTSTATTTIVVQNFNSHFQISASYWTTGTCPPVLAQFTNTSAGYSSVSWDFGDGVTAGNTNYPSHVYQQPGDYTVTLSVFGVGGLIGKYTDVVSVRQPSATVAVAPAAVCIGQPVGLQATGVGVLNYLFDFGDGTVAAGTAASVAHVYQQPGEFASQLVVTDTVGCAAAAAAPADLTVNPNPVIDVSPVAPIACLGNAVTLSASGAVGYSWTPSTGLDRTNVASPVASPAATTSYQVTGTDANGCSGVATLRVKVVAPEKLAVTPDTTAICGSGVFGIKATGVDVYAWIGDTAGLSAVNTGDVWARPPGSPGLMHYTVVGSDSYGCFSDTVVVAVTVLPVPTVDAGPDVEVLQAQPVVLLGTGSADVVAWSWTPAVYLSCVACAQPVCTPMRGETYTATVTADDGCQASDTVVVKLICEESRVRIPDAFTPNGDGHNDRFNILGIGEVDHLVIYDRWGVKVFERNHFYTADPASGWDGTMGGQLEPSGVYAYFAQFSCPTGGTFARQGTVVLIR
jgi:gliding motility-associated-like protein